MSELKKFRKSLAYSLILNLGIGYNHIERNLEIINLFLFCVSFIQGLGN